MVVDTKQDGNLTDEQLLKANPEELTEAQLDRRMILEEKKRSDDEIEATNKAEIEEENKATKKEEKKAETKKAEIKEKEIETPIEDDKNKILSIEELAAKKKWKPEEAATQLNKAYQNLEHLIESKAVETKSAKGETEVFKKELADMKIKLAEMDGIKATLNILGKKEISADEKQKQISELDDKWRQIILENPSQFYSIMRQAVQEDMKKLKQEIYNEHIRKIDDKDVKEEEEQANRRVIDMLPGEKQEDKEAYFNTIKPEIDRIFEEKPYLKTSKAGLLDAVEILAGRGKIKYQSSEAGTDGQSLSEEEINRKKAAISGGGDINTSGGKAKLTSSEVAKMSQKERDKLSDAELDAIIREEERAIRKGE